MPTAVGCGRDHKPRRRLARQVHLVHARLLVERRPRPVRIDERHVRAHRRREHHARPAGGVEGREEAIFGRPREGQRVGSRRAGPPPDALPQLPRQGPPASRAGIDRRKRIAGHARRTDRAARSVRVRRRGDRSIARPLELAAQVADPSGEGGAHLRRRVAAPRPFELAQEGRRLIVQRRQRRRVLRQAPQPVGVQPVARRVGEGRGRDLVGLVREPLAHLLDDVPRVLAGERRRLPRGEAKVVRAVVVLAPAVERARSRTGPAAAERRARARAAAVAPGSARRSPRRCADRRRPRAAPMRESAVASEGRARDHRDRESSPEPARASPFAAGES